VETELHSFLTAALIVMRDEFHFQSKPVSPRKKLGMRGRDCVIARACLGGVGSNRKITKSIDRSSLYLVTQLTVPRRLNEHLTFYVSKYNEQVGKSNFWETYNVTSYVVPLKEIASKTVTEIHIWRQTYMDTLRHVHLFTHLR
jgi:hypothetical protein